MDDSFSFGKPARRQVAIRSPRVRAPRAEGSGGRSGTGRIALLVLGGIVVVVVVVGFMTFVKGGGEEIASGERTAVSQVGAAQDVDAKMTAQQTAAAVRQLYAEQGSFDAITAGTLHTFEPSSQYTGGASTGPHVVSVSSSSTGVGLAVLSRSGACFLERLTTSGVTYGTGTSCTGEAAASARASSWPA
jgi:predicted metalloprotease